MSGTSAPLGLSILSVRRIAPGLASFVALALAAGEARAADPPFETFPSGRPFVTDARPSALPQRACSFTRPVCVHARAAADALSALGVLEHAFDALHDVRALPAPEPDAAGGSPAFDVYLDGEASLRVGIESTTSVPWDRAAAFARVGTWTGGWGRFHLARALATGMLLALDGGADGETLSQESAYLAWCVTGVSSPLLDGLDEAQRHPDRPLVGTGPIDEASPSVLVPMLLDERFGAGPPGLLVSAMAHAERQRTPVEATQHRDLPDFAHVVRMLARGVDKKPDDVWLDLAMQRAFLGDRDDGKHPHDSAWLGPMGRVRFDTTWRHDELPRRLSFTPVSPTGAVYAWLDLRGAAPDLRVGAVLDWEGPSNMRWAVLRIDEDGREGSRIELTTENGITHVEREISNLARARALLVVGTNLGEISNLHPYRQAEAPYEPHGGTLYLFRAE